MKGLWSFAFCLLLANCGDPAKPMTMTNQRLIAGLQICGIDPTDAVQVNEESGDYLVFSGVAPYPETKMRCLAHTLVRADYGVRQSGDRFDRAYRPAWEAEFAIHTQELATSWLREHRPGESPPLFVRGKLSLGDFARELEKLCGTKPGALSVKRRSLGIPLPEDEPQSECLLMAALAADLEKQGFVVQAMSYE